MKHNKLCRANTGLTNRLPRLVTQVECVFVQNNISFMWRNKRAWYLVNTAIPSLPMTGLVDFHSFLLENISSTLATRGNYSL